MNRCRIAGLLVALFAFGTAQAELVIEITKGGSASPIAIVPFGAPESGVPVDVAQIVSNDLARSGSFEPLPTSDMIGRPTSGAEIDFSDWRLLGVDNVVVGNVTQTSDGYLIRFQLFDVNRATQLIGFRVPAGADTLRAAAHRVSDLIYEELTGIRGAFSTRIAYVSVEGHADDKRYQLIVADADGENETVITSAVHPLMSPAWSPDAKRIAYVSFEDRVSAIFVQTLSTGQRQRVSSQKGINGAPSWSPDGAQLALTLTRDAGNLDICVLDLASGQVRRLTDNPAIDTEPVWSADGKSILFTSDRGGGPQVYEVAAAGGRARRVTFEGNYNARPRISPDNKQVAVVHNDRGKFRIAVVDKDRGITQVLTSGSQDESPSFAPNGAMIIYATQQRGRGVLAAVSVDGSVSQSLTSRAGDVREPAWSPFLK